jgi:acetoin utilization protein AcuC
MSEETLVAFNPQGAKHHAHSDHSSGFCVFNDMAMAAQKFIGLMGWRVLYIDLDVHHGDGVEALLRDEPNAMTFSMHGDGFPGTGTSDDVDHHAYNTMFRQGTGDQHWVDDLWRFLRYEATPFMPHVVMLACGADSHRTDPLGGLQITVDGYAQAADLVWEFADAFTDGRVLIGGAGGYQPEFWTPMIWATVAQRFSVGVAERAKPVYATP